MKYIASTIETTTKDNHVEKEIVVYKDTEIGKMRELMRTHDTVSIRHKRFNTYEEAMSYKAYPTDGTPLVKKLYHLLKTCGTEHTTMLIMRLKQGERMHVSHNDTYFNTKATYALYDDKRKREYCISSLYDLGRLMYFANTNDNITCRISYIKSVDNFSVCLDEKPRMEHEYIISKRTLYDCKCTKDYISAKATGEEFGIMIQALKDRLHTKVVRDTDKYGYRQYEIRVDNYVEEICGCCSTADMIKDTPDTLLQNMVYAHGVNTGFTERQDALGIMARIKAVYCNPQYQICCSDKGQYIGDCGIYVKGKVLAFSTTDMQSSLTIRDKKRCWSNFTTNLVYTKDEYVKVKNQVRYIEAILEDTKIVGVWIKEHVKEADVFLYDMVLDFCKSEGFKCHVIKKQMLI